MTQHDRDLVLKLVTLGRVTASEALHVWEKTNDPITASAFGGEQGREWSEKIISGLIRNAERDRDVKLERIGYDNNAFLYVGLTAANEPRILEHVVRVPNGDIDFARAEVLTVAGEWTSVPVESSLVGRDGIALDADLLAFTASAFTSGHQSVLLHEEVPILFLDEVPLIAAVAPGDIDDGSHFYAIVDPTDTTAVMSVIKISPGPQVYIRNGGAWTLDQTTLDSLMSVSPPPLVELQGDTLSSVLQQTDASQAQQVTTSGDGDAQAGDNLMDEPVKQQQIVPGKTGKATAANSGGKETASKGMTAAAQLNRAYCTGLSAAQTARLRACNSAHVRWSSTDTQNGWSLTAAIEAADTHATQRTYDIRRTSMKSALSLLASLRASESIMQLLLPAALLAEEQRFIANSEPLIADASQSLSDRAKGHLEGAERLKQYWTSNPRAVAKIRWGVPGDFDRCRRAVGKYLPAHEVDGYCANLHHRATGFWPGHAPTEQTGKKH
jgi:hypothetical protein